MISEESFVISSPNCGYCKQAKSMLSAYGIQFKEYNIMEDDGFVVAETFRQVFGDFKTVPQIVIKGDYVGGFQELKELLV